MPEFAFSSSGSVCRGFHFPPAAPFTPSTAGAPTVILGHGFGGTWRSGLQGFAQHFAENGFHAVAFDYRFLGTSDGHPRQLITISRQLADWHAVLACVRGLEGVDPDRVFLWGASLGGGHAIRVATEDNRVAGVIALSPLLDGTRTLLHMAQEAGIAHINRLLARGMLDLGSTLMGGGPRTLPIVAPPGSPGALTSPEADPGYRAIAGPDWENRFCARLALTIGAYRPGRLLDRLQCPLLLQIPEKDQILPLSATERWLRRLGPGDRVIRYPGGHFDVYFDPLFKRIAGDQTRFLKDLAWPPDSPNHRAGAHSPAEAVDYPKRSV